MVNYKYRDLFLQNGTHYDLIITCDGKTVDNTGLRGAWELTESLTENKLIIGQCVPSVITLRMVNDGTSYVGRELECNLVLDGHDDEPFPIGLFRCYSETLENDRKSRVITAYDKLYDVVHSDVKAWYDNVEFPITLKAFRDSFFAYFGIEQEEVELPNDGIVLTRKIADKEISGKTIAESICQANGCFGHIGRDGIFKYVFFVQSMVPADTLYPSADLFPSMDREADLSVRSYKSLKYEDYTVQSITGVRILVEENAEGTMYGTNENVLTLSGNSLLYNQNKAVLDIIAENILRAVSGITFTPIELEMKSDMCLEVGDRIEVLHRNGTTVSSFVLNRTIRGIQSFMDRISSRASEKQEVKTNSIQQKIESTRAQGDANTRRITSVEADNARIYGTLSAQRADIDEIKTKKLDADKLSAEVAKLGYATINQLNATNVTVSGKLDTNQLAAAISALTGVSAKSISCSSYLVNYGGRGMTLNPIQVNIGGQQFVILGVQYLG